MFVSKLSSYFFESCTESESKLVIKHFIKVLLFFSLLSLQHKTTLHSNTLYRSACVLSCVGLPVFKQLHMYAGVLYRRSCKVQLVHYFVFEIQLKLDISYK